ncbi:hypothetical protein C8Q70DRAFT_1049746 [Cubamyces menziesii]|uniref:BTB domain-containing protein n=1 Tax=Trametes cubensis TaxID=1111947 RepID=A0AAD7U096_9APHY|nr:hypothetical protein C8Q70DRAFT_1049746 [Cubamyces menziesii]KAJ8490207.1 hypothetical protein ONZ51_g2430 [Trametes cubensis]
MSTQASPSSGALFPNTSASTPFDRPSADSIILHTSDGVDFHVHSVILSEASAFFNTMLQLPQPGTPHFLLRLLYPISKQTLNMGDPARLLSIVMAAQKYDMDWPVEILSERLTTLAPLQPVKVWATACCAGLEDVAHQAAIVLRRTQGDADPGSDALPEGSEQGSASATPEALSIIGGLGDMDGISAADYLRLKRFLRATEAQVSEGTMKLLSPPSTSLGRSKRPRQHKSKKVAPPETTILGLPKLRPGSPTSCALFPPQAGFPAADVLCRAISPMGSHHVLPAHQAVLCAHSPVLRDRLSVLRGALKPTPEDVVKTPHPEPATSEDRQPNVVLDFDDGIDVVSALLRVCYGGHVGLPSGLGMLGRLLSAARKYDMSQIGHAILPVWDTAAKKDPLEAYCVATNHRLTDLARAAAKISVRQPTVDVYLTVMEQTPALAYHRLLAYRDTCFVAMQERVMDAETKIPETTQICIACANKYPQGGIVNTSSMKSALVGTRITSDPGESVSEVARRAIQRSVKSCIPQFTGRSVAEGFRDMMRTMVELLGNLPDEIERALQDIEIEVA